MTARRTQPCRRCGKPVAFVNATDWSGQRITVALDLAAPIYVREPDGEGGAVWAQWRTDAVAVAHHAVCPEMHQLAPSGGAT